MEAMRYTAVLYSANQAFLQQSADDFNRLTIKLMTNIETQNNYTTGVVTDNQTGNIIFRCRKAAME
jgi:hypothetical protein